MSTSDVPVVTRRHTRVGIPNIRPICCPIINRIPLRRIERRGFYLRVRGPCFALPVRARRAKARERLPSFCEPASRNPQAVRRGLFRNLRTRTVSPSTHPRPASGGAADFFLASALSISPTGLAASRWRRRAMHPTDFCHPNELRAPAPRVFPTPLATFAAWMPHGVLGSVRRYRGSGRFTTSIWTASADRRSST
jgi:hypothetical protein